MVSRYVRARIPCSINLRKDVFDMLKIQVRAKASLTEGCFHACKTLLAHFHFWFVCTGPLSAKGKGLRGVTDDLTFEQLTFIQNLQEEVALQKSNLGGLKDVSMHGTEMYWCFQAFCEDWRADQPHCGPIDGFTEDVLMSF
ncbi:hypothetical protein K458DRAFT_287212 [Lentithecium fluviatile CBS 122367]|uniref:Uncharacterized protein n=1 Tax=Lentithecium fluviatile CBS 122367 TaxID=1168545 RepID=A0A6G1JM75_9PLEO|nr:hypothetical protein K458DRAFT_287212 [Lentithecium fluviatile CBS 122367]